MRAFDTTLYRGYELRIEVISCFPVTGKFIGYVTVSFLGTLVGEGHTMDFSRFMLAENSACQIGKSIVDAVFKQPKFLNKTSESLF